MFRFTEDAIEGLFYHDLNSSAFTSSWYDMRDFDRIVGHIVIGATFTDAALTTVKFQQSQSSTGSNPIDVPNTSYAGAYASGNFTPDTGNEIYIEARAADFNPGNGAIGTGLVPGNGYRYAALYVAVTGPGGSDLILASVTRHQCTKRQAQLPGAGWPISTAPATRVYVVTGV